MTKYIFRKSNKDNWEKIGNNIVNNILKLGKECEVEVKKIKKPPTNNQRGYYFSVILPAIQNYFRNEGNYIADLTLLDRDIRNAIKDRFGLYREEISRIDGKTHKYYISLSNKDGNLDDTRQYIEAVLFWALEDYGLEISNPYYKI